MADQTQTDVCIIGAGPAGLMAAIYSAANNAQTLLLESNSAVARKLLLTGSGRCNFTHNATPDEIARAFGPKGRFLKFSLHQFPPDHVRRFFRDRGLDSKVEPSGCVFPNSDRATDVRNVLLAEAKKLGTQILFSKKVKTLTKRDDHFAVTSTDRLILARKVIITTGGLSYPDTGSTGDGYEFARRLGHTIVPPKPSLVPLVTLEKWPARLAGTPLENISISAALDKNKFSVSGPLLFTHDGISGPAALDLSRHVTAHLPNNKNPLKISLRLLSDINEAELEKIILRQVSDHPKKSVVNILADLVPRRLSLLFCSLLNLPDNLLANQLNKATRKKLLRLLKSLPLSIVRTKPLAEAMATQGGVTLTEIEPKTMESKISPHLFFAGEVIDLDGPCGGYNLQMCFATAALAGAAAAKNTPPKK